MNPTFLMTVIGVMSQMFFEIVKKYITRTHKFKWILNLYSF